MTVLQKTGTGEYASADGRIRIIHDPTFQTYCDGEHPVRMRVDRLPLVYSDQGVREMMNRGRIRSKWSRSEGRYVEYLTYQCPGDEMHFYAMWTVEIAGEWTDDVYDTFSQARGAAEAAVGPLKVTRRRPA